MNAKLLGVLSLIPFLLVGCNNSANSVIESEKYYSAKILEEYDKNLSTLSTVEENILSYIVSENEELNIDDFIGSNISKSSVVNTLNEAKSYVKTSIDSDNLLAEELRNNGEDKELENLLVRDYDYFRDNTISYHFLSRDSGSIEQYIVVYDRDSILKISLNWVGGVIADAKVSRYN